jgi:Transmembrane domain of unknown function (DUF3566)
MTGKFPDVMSMMREHSPSHGVARHAVTVSRVDPWTVLKISLILYFCFLLVVMVGLAVFWVVLTQLGVIRGLTSSLDKLQLTMIINGGNIARALFLVGVLNVILWSAINVFLAYLYNLIADIIGGLRVELDAEEPLCELRPGG